MCRSSTLVLVRRKVLSNLTRQWADMSHVQIFYTLNLSDTTTKFLTVAVFVTAHKQ
jgi:hypothetical protein